MYGSVQVQNSICGFIGILQSTKCMPSSIFELYHFVKFTTAFCNSEFTFVAHHTHVCALRVVIWSQNSTPSAFKTSTMHTFISVGLHALLNIKWLIGNIACECKTIAPKGYSIALQASEINTFNTLTPGMFFQVNILNWKTILQTHNSINIIMLAGY